MKYLARRRRIVIYSMWHGLLTYRWKMDDPWDVLTPRGTDRGTDGLQGAAVAVRTHGSHAHGSCAHSR